MSGALEQGLRIALRAIRALALCVFTYTVILMGYVACRQQPFFPARELSLSVIDRAVPFIPETVWLYGTVSYTTLFALFWIRDRAGLRRLVLTLVAAAAICWVGFAIYPVAFPRHLYPLPAEVTASTQRLAELRLSDYPDNCLPSLHVALASALALTLTEQGQPRWLRLSAPLWAFAIAVSTLTVKQHYFVDVWTGALAGLVAHRACLRAARGRPYWTTAEAPLALVDEEGRRFVQALRKKVEAHQWSLDDLELAAPRAPLDKAMVRLLNHVIYIEEIAARNFRFLGRAARDEDVRALYEMFELEEARHAEGLRRLLIAGGGWLERPGLGNALVLDQQRHLDPASDADVVLVTVSNPVFETFLDAGTIPFLQAHPALRGPAFDRFVSRVTRDEAAHIALNWFFVREIGKRHAHLRHLSNPAIARGMLAIPFMSLDVYALAHRLGYDFATLLPSFRKLWKNDERFPELRRLPLWLCFRLFVAIGLAVTYVVLGLVKLRILLVSVWTHVSRVTDWVAWAVFGERLLTRHALPASRRRASGP
jgi:membrane-associated phospholipid phosphatase